MSHSSDLNNNSDDDQAFDRSDQKHPSSPTENRPGLAARRSAQLPKLKDINKRIRNESVEVFHFDKF